jgi:hypothetical protein
MKMDRIKHFILLIVLYFSISTVSVGQETFVFPLQIGNKWFLQGDEPGIYDYIITYTIIDTVRINQLLYYDINPGLFATDGFYRIDSLGNFIECDNGNEIILCNFAMEPGDLVLIRFDPETSDSAFCHCRKRRLIQSIVGEEKLEISYDQNWSQIHTDQYTYLNVMDGIGLTALGKVWYDNPYKLIGAIIENQFYGDSIATSIKEKSNLPHTFSLHQNFPNPFNNQTTFIIELDELSFIELKIFDITGRKVQTLISKSMPAGRHEVSWNASNYSTGIYLCELRKNNYSLIRKIVMQK